GLVEDDGYDGPGFDPDDEFEPEPEPERDRRRHQPPHQVERERERDRERDEPVRVVQPPAQREPVQLPAESGRPARIAPVAS
ncbi:cell division protein SepF, partial [Streptomyces sp. SID8455]|nr:cell division protein SepF [Streptomyces sp. SID8455]